MLDWPKILLPGRVLNATPSMLPFRQTSRQIRRLCPMVVSNKTNRSDNSTLP
jgi:hypothetical protein